eukprot:TRINITY_DN793_c0_g1_i1.p1 TRINITY_DN793_c0_g1~~TRINITY_DN793_c0_g1_i1.p1  ORF type:complete len:798 (+),score=113.73 TRINITY_DN793_c0_g1_i1:1503-3896(+)
MTKGGRAQKSKNGKSPTKVEQKTTQKEKKKDNNSNPLIAPPSQQLPTENGLNRGLDPSAASSGSQANGTNQSEKEKSVDTNPCGGSCPVKVPTSVGESDVKSMELVTLDPVPMSISSTPAVYQDNEQMTDAFGENERKVEDHKGGERNNLNPPNTPQQMHYNDEKTQSIEREDEKRICNDSLEVKDKTQEKREDEKKAIDVGKNETEEEETTSRRTPTASHEEEKLGSYVCSPRPSAVSKKSSLSSPKKSNKKNAEQEGSHQKGRKEATVKAEKTLDPTVDKKSKNLVTKEQVLERLRVLQEEKEEKLRQEIEDMKNQIKEHEERLPIQDLVWQNISVKNDDKYMNKLGDILTKEPKKGKDGKATILLKESRVDKKMVQIIQDYFQKDQNISETFQKLRPQIFKSTNLSEFVHEILRYLYAHRKLELMDFLLTKGSNILQVMVEEQSSFVFSLATLGPFLTADDSQQCIVDYYRKFNQDLLRSFLKRMEEDNGKFISECIFLLLDSSIISNRSELIEEIDVHLFDSVKLLDCFYPIVRLLIKYNASVESQWIAPLIEQIKQIFRSKQGRKGIVTEREVMAMQLVESLLFKQDDALVRLLLQHDLFVDLHYFAMHRNNGIISGYYSTIFTTLMKSESVLQSSTDEFRKLLSDLPVVCNHIKGLDVCANLLMILYAIPKSLVSLDNLKWDYLSEAAEVYSKNSTRTIAEIACLNWPPVDEAPKGPKPKTTISQPLPPGEKGGTKAPAQGSAIQSPETTILQAIKHPQDDLPKNQPLTLLGTGSVIGLIKDFVVDSISRK